LPYSESAEKEERTLLNVIHGDWLFDGNGHMIPDGAVAYDGNGIVRVGPFAQMDLPADASVVDRPGETILPGIVNSHSHCSIIPGLGNQSGQQREPLPKQLIRSIGNLRKEIMSGVTTFRVMGDEHYLDMDLRRAIDAGQIPGPRLLTCGLLLTASNGHGRALTVTDGPDAIRKRVRENLAAGADVTKVFMTGGTSSTGMPVDFYSYTKEEILAACEETHRAGKRVAVHAHGGPGLKICIEAGCDTIEHGKLATKDDIDEMIKRGTWLVVNNAITYHPTGIEQSDGNVPEIWAKLLRNREVVKKNFPWVLKSGVKWAVGTDSMHGLMHFEMKMLVEFGVSPEEAIVASTKRGAEACDLGDKTGTLEPGKWADIISVKGNPLSDITCMKDIGVVVKAGVRQDGLSPI
jgi:imidazolonepropionase-like amidohydrolase